MKGVKQGKWHSYKGIVKFSNVVLCEYMTALPNGRHLLHDDNTSMYQGYSALSSHPIALSIDNPALPLVTASLRYAGESLSGYNATMLIINAALSIRSAALPIDNPAMLFAIASSLYAGQSLS